MSIQTALIDSLCEELCQGAHEADRGIAWPHEQIRRISDAGVFRWFLPAEYGGVGWSETEILEGYLALSRSCLTTTFILTQWNAACKRILGSQNETLKQTVLPQMASGQCFATVGISHLSTSRQHVSKPVLEATARDEGFELNGFSPWVTAAPAVDLFVVGATLVDGTQVMLAVPSDTDGVRPSPGAELVGLNGSCTDQVTFEKAWIAQSQILAGPVANVLSTNSGGGAGGLQTSTLAVGLSLAAIGYLREQAERRSDLHPIAEKLGDDADDLLATLRALTAGKNAEFTASGLRQKANSLVLRSTQAALSAAKGAGYVASHPAGRWAKEALFFLVWSCPQPVVNANLCELAQLAVD
ncbi:MAG: acyl-CoA dehydrogenase family protein [Aureliella sp.]